MFFASLYLFIGHLNNSVDFYSKKRSDRIIEITSFNHKLSLVVLINSIKSAVPAIFRTILAPSHDAHNGVGNDTVNDNSKKMMPTNTFCSI